MTDEKCAGCGKPVEIEAMVEHQLKCPAWAGDAEPDWGCVNCKLVWIGPRGNLCARCHSREIIGFWSVEND